jgi:DNA-binding MarR family transcriptional regulator
MDNVKIDLSENAERIPGFLLWQVSKLWQRYLNEALEDLNISSTQAVILGNIVRWVRMDKDVTQIMLSEQTKIDPMTTSQAIRTLEKKELIIREPSKEDKRAYHVQPTPKGIEVMDQALQRFVRAHEAFFEPLKGDLEAFAAQLRQLIEYSQEPD